jgi:hypothetical protein
MYIGLHYFDMYNEGYTPYCLRPFYSPPDSKNFGGKVMHIDQDGDKRSKWVCVIFCVNDENAGMDDMHALQVEYISRVARGLEDGRKFPKSNEGYLSGVIAIGPRTKFYEYKLLGDGKIDGREMRMDDSNEPLGEVNILEDGIKVHKAVVRIKKRSAMLGN